MRRGVLLIAGLLLIGGGLVKAEVIPWPWTSLSEPATANATVSETPFITAEELKRRMDLGEEIVVADVRRKDAYDKLHLAGALSMPMNDHPKWASKLSKEVPLVLYCACDGDESALLAAKEIRRRYGHPKVMVLKGGLGSWVEAGYPIVERKPPTGLKKIKPEPVKPD